MKAIKRNFENVLYELKEKIKEDEYAKDLYRALCNTKWRNVYTLKYYVCTWRYAGGLIARVRNKGEDYLNFYCSGNEGFVSDTVKKDLAKLGWKPIKYGE